MSGSMSNYLENKLLDHSLGTTSFTMPSGVFAALYTVAPSDSGGGTEVTGGSYSRKSATFAAASSGTAANSNNIDFTGMPAATVVAIGLFDASTSGNLLFHGTLNSAKTVDSGDTLRIAIGDLSITLD
jgi:hypothetical protein